MRTTVQRACVACGTHFETKPSEVARRGGKYCSRACYHGSQRRSPEARFLAYAAAEPTETGCILWTGDTTAHGYGRLNATRIDGRRMVVFAHRFAWEFARGAIPPGLHVLHRCDAHYSVEDVTYRRCVNPVHLFLGTPAINMADKTAKGRQSKGESSGLAKLTAADVIAMRERAAGGATRVSLAAEYGISLTNVYAVLSRRSWKHV